MGRFVIRKRIIKYVMRMCAGECRLENMRTLCIACHADVTLAQCRERRSERAKAKKQLKRLLANITLVNNCKEKVKQKNYSNIL